MKTIIPAPYYFADEIYQKEKQFLFNNLWQYVGLTDKLAHHQDYICVTIDEKSIIVMNFEGELRAFHNVCSHRLSRILSNEAGNGFLQCQYHGWTYDRNGFPYAIPKKKCFSSLDAQSLKLTAFPVANCGRFVFVKLGEAGQSLSDYLGDMQNTLQDFSTALGNSIDHNSMQIQANWKVVIENTLEDYHVRMVHPESLNQLGIEERSYSYSKQHSSTNLEFKIKLEKSAYVAKAYQERPLQIEDYTHYLIFPNLTIASAYGTTISIQQVIPLGPKQTCFISQVYATQFKQDSTPNKAVINAFNHSAVEFNRKVFAEDKTVCEQVQKGLEEATRHYGFLSDDEQRVYAFQGAYMELFNKIPG